MTAYNRFPSFQHCELAQNQKAMKKLTERQTSTMIKVSLLYKLRRKLQTLFCFQQAATDAQDSIVGSRRRLRQGPVVESVRTPSRLANGERGRPRFGAAQVAVRRWKSPRRSKSHRFYFVGVLCVTWLPFWVVMPRDGVWRYEQERFYVPASANAYGLLVIGRRKDDPGVM